MITLNWHRIGGIGLFLAGISLGFLTLLNFNAATIIIEWETASEVDTLGFNIQRGETETGPVERLNPALIQPSSDPLTGGAYTYKDETAQPGKTYFYFLEEIESSGNTNQHGPIVQTAPQTQFWNLILAGSFIVSAFLVFKSEAPHDA